jgi:hypothetical protein
MRSSETEISIVDTFPDFEEYWKRYRNKSSNLQLDGWIHQYMVKRPELFKIQTHQYKSEGVAWKSLAKRRIFPELNGRLSQMRVARDRLLAESYQVIRSALVRLHLRMPVCVVIYVGIGLGAGWATKYQNKPALLFGLENIAEEHWTSPQEIRGLIAHEFGHLVHAFWRAKARKKFLSNPLWQLYTEGFADSFETSSSGEYLHRENSGREWTAWCTKNKKWLASEFLNRLDKKKDLRPFFGSWYQLRRHSQTGYFLGTEAIKTLQKSFSLQEIAVLDKVSVIMKQAITAMKVGSL